MVVVQLTSTARAAQVVMAVVEPEVLLQIPELPELPELLTQAAVEVVVAF